MSENIEGTKPKSLLRRVIDTVKQQTEQPTSEPDPVNQAKQILNRTKLTETASYWSGLPASRRYCDENELKKLFDMVSQQVSEPAAHSLANMLIDMPSLAPSNIVRATLSLADNNWVYDTHFSERILEGKTDTKPVKFEEADSIEDKIAEGFFGKVAATEDKPDESNLIREAFKKSLGRELTEVMATRNIIEGKASRGA